MRLQVIYPLTPEEAAAAEEGSSPQAKLEALDARLAGLMAVVRLRYLVQRQGGWDSEAEWGDVLSLGTLPFPALRKFRAATFLCLVA